MTARSDFMKLSLGKCWGLLIFDIIGLAISGYAFLLGYQVLATLPSANAYIILMGFFVGIKVVVLSLYDLNRNMLHKNIPFLGALISVIGNGIIFTLCFFLIPEVPIYFFVGLTIADFIFISLCHFLWWVLIGKDEEVSNDNQADDKKETKKEPKKEPKQGSKQRSKKGNNEKKTWLAREDENESEYDSIFTSLLENEKRGQQQFVDSPKVSEPRPYEDEKRYQTSDFLNDIKENLKKEHKMPPQKLESRVASNSKYKPQEQMPIETEIPEDLPTTEPGKKKEEADESIKQYQTWKMEEPIQKIPEESSLKVTNLLSKKDRNELFKDLPNIQAKDTTPETAGLYSENTIGLDEFPLENEENILSIERRLEYLFHEIEKSMQETQYLQRAVGDFQQEVETYEPIAGDENIVAAGNLIREKLKMIIDKQFVVDEVLDDLIRLSKLINNRINDLDIIEAGLNQRKIALDQKDVLLVETRREDNTMDSEIEILPEEVVLESLDSEFIVAEGDYESIRKYLTQNPDQ